MGKREKKNRGKKKRVKRETCLVGLEPPEPLPKGRPWSSEWSINVG